MGRTEARKLELGHVDLQRGGTNGGGDAKSSRTLARQHAAIADGHAQAARNSRAPDVIAAHRDAEDLHRQRVLAITSPLMPIAAVRAGKPRDM